MQLRSIGAIMLRELHTRFGRNNVGYLWLLLEPAILAGGVSSIHLFAHVSLPFGFTAASFYASGYITYVVFRNNVNRAAPLVESNKPLLYHKNVTLTDIAIARCFLEGLAVLGAMVIIVGCFVLLGLAPMPQRPWYILLGLALMLWLSTGVAMIISAAVAFNPLIDRFVHPATYLMMPFSGMFYVLDQLPRSFSGPVSWAVIPQITDIVRMGLLSDFQSTYVNYTYIFSVCIILTLIGLVSLRIIRRHIHFD